MALQLNTTKIQFTNHKQRLQW